MKERSPSYYAAFHCLAGACPHTCCAAGWEIPLDRETALRYESLPGTLGERLRGVLRRDAAGEASERSDAATPGILTISAPGGRWAFAAPAPRPQG